MLTASSNALRQLTFIKEGADYTKKEYSWSDLFDPKNDRGLWNDMKRDVVNLPSIDLRDELTKLLNPHLDPQPQSLRKCRNTLGRIAENILAMTSRLAPILQLDQDITTAVQFQGCDMMETDVVTDRGVLGPVMQIEKTVYASAMLQAHRFKDLIYNLGAHRYKNRTVPAGKQEPEPIVARVIKRGGQVVGYHLEELDYQRGCETVQMVRMGADPRCVQEGVHTAIIVDILRNINARMPFNSLIDGYLPDETSMLKIE